MKAFHLIPSLTTSLLVTLSVALCFFSEAQAQFSVTDFSPNQSLTLDVSPYESEPFQVSWLMKIPTGKMVYYELCTDPADGPTWKMKVSFDAGNKGSCITNRAGFSFPYPLNREFEVTQIVNLQENWLQLIIDDRNVAVIDFFQENLAEIKFFVEDCSMAVTHSDNHTNVEGVSNGAATHFHPVCGSNGKNYINAAAAKADGVLHYTDGYCSDFAENIPGRTMNAFEATPPRPFLEVNLLNSNW